MASRTAVHLGMALWATEAPHFRYSETLHTDALEVGLYIIQTAWSDDGIDTFHL
jgi:hypothetical protein